MLLKALQFSGFRNLEEAVIEPGLRFNVFSGDNGQGKTNLLEALYAVCTLRSFRSSRLRDLISIHENSAKVSARVERGGLERRYDLEIKERSRIVRLDNKAVRPISKYFGEFNVVLFAPEDLLVARGSPGDKRKFLDRAVFTMNPSYLASVQDYEKVVKNRNLCLKDENMGSSQKSDMLAVYDLQMAKLGTEIYLARHSYLQTIASEFRNAFEAITHIDLEADIEYLPSGELDLHQSREDVVAAFADKLEKSRSADLARGSSNVGPHRDGLNFKLAGQQAANFASQGQLRAMILAWKSAEMLLLAKAHEDPPILLLDDVSSELDPQRNEYLFAFLRERENQCFITTTHPDFVLLDSDRRDFSVSAGKIRHS